MTAYTLVDFLKMGGLLIIALVVMAIVESFLRWLDTQYPLPPRMHLVCARCKAPLPAGARHCPDCQHSDRTPRIM